MSNIRLIINADDFGLHPQVNEGIIAGHTGGCVTSATIMPGAAAFEQAIALAHDHPRLGVGVHLTLVAERPVLDPAEIASLVDREGRFYRYYPTFMKQYFSGKIRIEDIRRELTAQVRRAQEAGLAISHLDSHQHLHILPGVLEIVLDIAKQFGIRAMRVPGEDYLFTGGYPLTVGRWLSRNGLTSLAKLARWKARRQGIVTTNHFFGMLAGGNMREAYLMNILNRLSPGTSEIMLHPGADTAKLRTVYGWGYDWEAELAAIISPRVLRRIQERRIELITFRELP